MPTVKVPLSSTVYRNVKGEELSDNDYLLLNGYVNELGYTVKRPGLSLALDLSQGMNRQIDGLFWWPHKQCALAVCSHRVYKLEYVSNTLSATDVTTDTLIGDNRPYFAISNNANVATPTIYGLIANGGEISIASGTGLAFSNFSTLITDEVPTEVTHLDSVDSYVIATNGKNTFQFSQVTDPTSWPALSYASAMRNPDNIRALKVYNRQIFLFGDQTTEIWENDGSSPFSPIPGGYIETGVLAPNSLVRTPLGLFWLSSDRKFVSYSSSEGLKRVSSPFDREISLFSDLREAFSYYMDINGQPFILVTFEAENRTLVYNIIRDTWSEWTYYDSDVGANSRFIGNCYVYSPIWGIHLVGSRKDSKIYLMSDSYKDDSGDVIMLKKTTGHIDYGSTSRKLSKELRVRVTRGEGLNNGAAKFVYRWNDDNKGWSNEEEVSLGFLGEREIVVRLFPQGIYRTRQYEFTLTDSVGLSFGEAEEDINILQR